MTKHLLKYAAAVALTLASAGAFADDPTGVLLRERGQAPLQNGPVAQFSDVGPCQPGTQSEPFPNQQGFRCVPER